MNTGYRTCKGIPFGKEFENVMKDFAIPMAYVCDRNGCVPVTTTKLNNSVSIDPKLSSYPHPSSNLSSYHHENVLSGNVYDSFLKNVLYKPHSKSIGKGHINIHIVEIPPSTKGDPNLLGSSSSDSPLLAKTRKRKKSVKSNVKTRRKRKPLQGT